MRRTALRLIADRTGPVLERWHEERDLSVRVALLLTPGRATADEDPSRRVIPRGAAGRGPARGAPRVGEDPLLPGDVTPYPQPWEPPLPEPAEAAVLAHAADGQGQLEFPTAPTALADPAGAGSPHGTRRPRTGRPGARAAVAPPARASDACRGRS